MHIAGFDRGNTRNEPAFHPLSAMRPRQITRDRAKFGAFQVRARWRQMRLVRPSPAPPEAVDDLKQKRRGGGSPDKICVWPPVKVSHPNREDVMIENRNGPRVMKTMRRSRFPEHP